MKTLETPLDILMSLVRSSYLSARDAGLRPAVISLGPLEHHLWADPSISPHWRRFPVRRMRCNGVAFLTERRAS